MATYTELRKSMTAGAMRKMAPIVRPSLASLSRRALREIAVTTFALYLGTRPAMPRSTPLYASVEEVILVMAPPRAGKTAWLANRVLEAVGPSIVTSTKTDLYRLTAGLRGKVGNTALFNPEGLGDLESTFRWSPVAGCQDPEVALDRAAYLLSGSPGAAGVTNRNFWEGTSNEVLRAYLHAAALADLSMGHVWEWASNPADLTPVKILNTHPKAAHGWASKLAQILQQPRDTRDNIFQTLSLTLAFMANPRIAATMQVPAAQSFDIDAFIGSRDTLYLIGAHRRHNSVAPLFTAFVGALFERAKYLSQAMPGGRLDPPLQFNLDEAALICPVPLEQWTSDAGGRGIPLIIAVQSIHQLYDRYGRDRARTIFDNSAVKLVLGGSTATENLKEISELCGTRLVQRSGASRNPQGGMTTSTHTVTEPVMSTDDIRRLPKWRALVIHRSTRPVIVHFQNAWERKDVTEYFRSIGQPVPGPEPTTEPHLVGVEPG